MAGNPCEELSPTGEKKKKKRQKQNQVFLHCSPAVLRIKSSQLINHKCSSKPGDLPRTQ